MIKAAAVVAAAALLLACPSPGRADDDGHAIAMMAATWNSIHTYEVTVTVHETKGASVQDRVYRVCFQQPMHTRVDIIGGDGRGMAAIWDGGDTVRGHQGGMLSFLHLNVGIHDRLATDLRGGTIAQANFGALLEHLRSLDPHHVRVTSRGGRTILVVDYDPAEPNSDITKEVYIFGSNWLPAEFFEYADETLVRHVVNTGLKVNLALPDSTWRL